MRTDTTLSCTVVLIKSEELMKKSLVKQFGKGVLKDDRPQ